jgi:hypothetical protein
MEDLWKVALGVAGLGALACFVFWSLYRQWLKLPIWTQMTKRHQFIVIIVFLGSPRWRSYTQHASSS